MKKVLTLLLAVVAFSATQAQSREEARRVILGNGANYPAYSQERPYGDRQFEIDRINREYDGRIRSVWNDPYLHHGQKKKAVRDLERERRIRLDEMSRRYNDWNHRHYDRH